MATDTQTTATAGQGRLASLAADEGLRLLLRQRCIELTQAYSALHQRGDEEALHDFRVALRRLRSLLRSYRRVFAEDGPLSVQLRALQQQTNRARDLEVMLAQLSGHYPPGSPLLQLVAEQLHEAYQQLAQCLPPQWAILAPLLEPALVPSEGTARLGTFGRLTSRIGGRQRKRLKLGLKALRREWDDANLHRLRIQGKRLRYLLEPFAEERDCAHALKQLKSLQEAFGGYRDQQLLLHHLSELTADDAAHCPTVNEITKVLHTDLERCRQGARKYRKHGKQQKLLSSLRRALKQLKR